MERNKLLCCLLLVMPAITYAAIIPVWRGNPNATHQLWTFSTDANPASPEYVSNPYGDPTAAVFDDDPVTMNWLYENRGHQGVWKTKGFVKIDMPNTDMTEPDTFKRILVQMIYDAGIDALGRPIDAWLRIATPADPLSPGIRPDFSRELPDGYRYSRWWLTLKPNPTEETIYLLPFYCNLYVDAIEIDTICIPEPATLSMLGLGALGSFLLRKRF